MTEEVIYYTDATPPNAYTGSLKTGISAFESGGAPLIQYKLYEDTETWNAWEAWAD